MSEVINVLDAGIGLLRAVFSVLVVLAAVLAALDWAVRTRRINAFGPLARFTRATVDPLVAPVERRLVRAGGTPASAPWWALLVLVVAGALIIGALGFVRDQFAAIQHASSRGPRGFVRLVVGWAFAVLQIAIFVRVILSWVGGTYSRIGRLAVHLTEWLIAPLRRALPTVGAFDISPLVALIGLMILQGIVMRAL